MYKAHFGFNEKPFNLVPNPSFLFLSSKHANALTTLEYALTEKVGFVMLTGEIGSGKTTLIRHLLNQIGSDMDVAVIFNTNILSNDLINLILTEFEIDYNDGISKAKALEALYEFLIQQYSRNRNVLLIIDEAQNLSEEVLEEIRMLSNLQTDDEMLLQIIIVGQPELRNKIKDPRLEQFAQRIAVNFHLSAMTLEETQEYIAHRIEKAGGEPGLFTMEAVERVYEASRGIPRAINLLCDVALVYGYADENQNIGVEIIEQVIVDKGEMGVSTQVSEQSVQREGIPDNGLLERIEHIENNFTQLKTYYHNYIDEIESRARFCRDEMVNTLKKDLALERKKNQALAVEYGKIKERYKLLKRIRQKQSSAPAEEGTGHDSLKKRYGYLLDYI